MMNSDSSLNQKQIPKWLTGIVIAVALLGFIDASYLTIKHFRHEVPPCSIIAGCETVTTSAYSEILGIPVALLGSLYYATILILAIAYIDTKKLIFLKLLAHLTWAGLAASLWFIYVQLFILHAICIYCMGSAATSLTLFILHFPLLRFLNNKTIKQ